MQSAFLFLVGFLLLFGSQVGFSFVIKVFISRYRELPLIRQNLTFIKYFSFTIASCRKHHYLALPDSCGFGHFLDLKVPFAAFNNQNKLINS